MSILGIAAVNVDKLRERQQKWNPYSILVADLKESLDRMRVRIQVELLLSYRGVDIKYLPNRNTIPYNTIRAINRAQVSQ